MKTDGRNSVGYICCCNATGMILVTVAVLLWGKVLLMAVDCCSTLCLSINSLCVFLSNKPC